MNDMGHNVNAIRLAALAGDAKAALDRVSRGEAEAFDGWLAFGAALNAGRALFAVGDNERFSEWVSKSQLANWPDGKPIGMDERAAAMWAAAKPDQFAEAKLAGNARTVRGIHAKWKEIESEREREAERQNAEAFRAEAEAQAHAEAQALREAQEALDEHSRIAAVDRADRAKEYRLEAESRVYAADLAARAKDKSALRDSVLAAVDDAANRPRREKNPLHKKDAARDRVFAFSGLCRSLAEYDDVELIAAWSAIPQTAERLPTDVHNAMLILSRFVEAKDA